MSMNTIGHWRALGAVVACFAALLSIGPSLSQSDMLELKVAAATNDVMPVTDSAFKLADTLGYYEKHGVRVEFIALEGTPQAVAALNSGAVDLADISIDSVLRLRAENDVGLRGVVSSTLGPPFLIAGTCDIKSVAELAGRSYAINDNGSLDHSLMQHVLTSNGVDPDSPQFIAIGAPAARAQALAAGRVDATTVSYGSYLPIADTPGLCVIVRPEDFFSAAPVQSKFLAALDSTIENKREAIQRFSDALIDMSRHFDSHPNDWVDAMVEARTDLARDDLVKTTDYLDGRWCVNGCINVGYIQETVDFIYDSPDFADVPVVSAQDVTDESFILQSMKNLGPYDGGGVDAR